MNIDEETLLKLNKKINVLTDDLEELKYVVSKKTGSGSNDIKGNFITRVPDKSVFYSDKGKIAGSQYFTFREYKGTGYTTGRCDTFPSRINLTSRGLFVDASLGGSIEFDLINGGGEFLVYSGNSNTSSYAGEIGFYAGEGTGGTTRGGWIKHYAGDSVSGKGGWVDMIAGDSTVSDGGWVENIAGAGTEGGWVNLVAGAGSANDGGWIWLQTGVCNGGGGQGGDLYIKLGHGNGDGRRGRIVIANEISEFGFIFDNITEYTKTLTFQNVTSTMALWTDKLSVFAATTSAELAGVISDETGSGLLVFGTNPTLSGITMADATDIVLNATTGTKIGTAITQKLGFFNVTPIVQPANTTDLKDALIALGFIATGGATPLDLDGGGITAIGNNSLGQITITDAKDIILGTTTGTKIGTATNQKLAFYNSAPVVQPIALTTQLTTITYTAPGTPDYALQDLVQNTGFGFVTKDEGNTTLSVIANLQTRVSELEAKLQSLGLLA